MKPKGRINKKQEFLIRLTRDRLREDAVKTAKSLREKKRNLDQKQIKSSHRISIGVSTSKLTTTITELPPTLDNTQELHCCSSSDDSDDDDISAYLDTTSLDYLDGEDEDITSCLQSANLASLSERDQYLSLIIAQVRHNWDNTSVCTIAEWFSLVSGRDDFRISYNSIYKNAGLIETPIEKFYYTKCGHAIKQVDKETLLKCGRKCNCSVNVIEAQKVQSSYFCYISLRSWLDFMVPKLYHQMRFSSNLKNENIKNGRIYRDILNGQEYDRITEGQDMLTLTLGWDGVCYCQSNSKSMWPLVAYINELKYKVRVRNALALALHCGGGKAPQSMLEPLINELLEFEKNPYEVKINGVNMSFKVRLLVVVADAPARARILNMKDFSGKYGCNNCQIQTFWCQTSRYPMTTNYTFRDAQKWREEAAKATPKNTWFGVKGECQLLRLAYVNPATIAPPEYLHSQILGTFRAKLECWLRQNKLINDKIRQPETKDEYLKYVFLDASQVNVAQKRINSVKFPSRFCRSMPDLTKISQAKAYDLENLLIYGYFAFEDLLPREVYQHFLRFVFIISSLNSNKITETTLRHCRTEINHYMQEFDQFYPVELNLYNIHTTNHLPRFVELYGPLLTWSAFQTENSMGLLSRRVVTFTKVSEQVLKKMTGYASVMTMCSSGLNTFTDDFREYILRRFPGLVGISHGLINCKRAAKKPLDPSERQKLQQLVMQLNQYKVFKVDRIYYGKMLINTDRSSNSLNNASFTVQTDKDYFQVKDIILIENKTNPLDKKAYLICKKYLNVNPAKVFGSLGFYYVHEAKSLSNVLYYVPITKIQRYAIAAKSGGKFYLFKIINNHL